MYCSCHNVCAFIFLYRYRRFCTIARKVGSGRPSKITDHVRQLVEQRMRLDDETTATQLCELLVFLSLFALWFVAGRSWGGPFEGLHTASLYDLKRGLSGRYKIKGDVLQM